MPSANDRLVSTHASTFPHRLGYIHTQRLHARTWAISSVIIANATTRMRILDPEATGRIRKRVFMRFYGNLFTSAVLLKIWNLVDILKKESISKDEYAVALFLLHRTLAGLPLPQSLPRALIPPSIRSHPLFQSSSYANIDHKIWDPKEGSPTDWNISESIRSLAARIFSAIDVQNVGYVEQDSVFAMMKRFELGERDSKRICRLLGLRKNPSVTLHRFTVAFFFVHWCLAGQDLPQTLPDALKTMAALGYTSSSSSSSSTPISGHCNSSGLAESDVLQSVQNYRLSLVDLTTENRRLREQRLTLQNVETSTAPLPASTIPPVRPVRPLPVPMSAPFTEVDVQVLAPSSQFQVSEPSETRTESEITTTSISAPSLSPGVDVQVSWPSLSSQPEALETSDSESNDGVTTIPPLNALRTEVEQLREMIERLMEENAVLNSSVRELQRQRNQPMGQRADNVEGFLLTDVFEVGDLPPPYEERIF